MIRKPKLVGAENLASIIGLHHDTSLCGVVTNELSLLRYVDIQTSRSDGNGRSKFYTFRSTRYLAKFRDLGRELFLRNLRRAQQPA